MKNLWNAYVIHTGVSYAPFMLNHLMMMVAWSLALLLMFYKSHTLRLIKANWNMSKKKNILFSNWRRRHKNPVKGKRFKKEKKFLTYTGHFLVINGFLGLMPPFYINANTLIATLLLTTSLTYLLIIFQMVTLNGRASFVYQVRGMHSRSMLAVMNSLIFSKNFINFCPKGVHPFMCQILVPVELLSILIRPVSLGVRMFANLTMGHIMIFGFHHATSYLAKGWWLWSCVNSTFLFWFYIFEIIVVYAQSIIFLYLVSTYLYEVPEIHE